MNISKNYQKDIYSEIDEIEKNHFWFKARNKIIIWALRKYFKKINSFCEIGCGTGNVLSHIEQVYQDSVLCGCDIFNEAIDCAKSRVRNVKLFQMDVTKMNFDNKYDVIGLFDVLEHIEDDSIVLKNVYKAVRKGGSPCLKHYPIEISGK